MGTKGRKILADENSCQKRGLGKTRTSALLGGVTLLLLLAGAGTTQAAMFYDNNVNLGIPDGGGAVNTLSRTIDVSGLAPTLSDITISLNVAAGWNGDLYATLRGPGGSSAPFAVLLNRVGVTTGNNMGYSDAGFNILLNLSGTDIHSYGGNNGPSAAPAQETQQRTAQPEAC